MGVEKCSKYEVKAYQYQKEKDVLMDRIKDLKSVPSNPTTNNRIKELQRKYDELEKKRALAMEQYYDCLSAGYGDKPK